MADKIITVKDAKEMADKITGTTPEQKEEEKSFFEELAQAISEVNPEMGGFEELAALLSLDDKQFSILAPVFLDELEKSFASSNDRLLLAQAMNSTDTKVEDIVEAYQAIVTQIDEQLTEAIPTNKRNFLKKMLGIVVNAISETEGTARRIVEVPVVLEDGVQMPEYARAGDAGLDVRANEEVTIAPGETVLIPTGIKMAIPKGYEVQIRPRSGLSLRTKLRIANSPATIDSSYRGDVGLIVENTEPRIKDITYTFDEDGRPVITGIEHGASITIGKGERIAQLVLSEVCAASFYKVDSVDNIGEDRGGGFGSTGTA